MLKFKSMNASIDYVPKVGFCFKDPDTGKEFKAKNYRCFEDLEYHVQNYRKQNNLPPIQDFREVWEHYICMNFSSERGNCCVQDASISRSFKQYVVGGIAYIKSVLQKEEEKFVSKEEAESRADICLRCKYNKKNYGHNFAQYYTDKMMARSVGARRVDRWAELYTCMGCSCVLNSKVWFSDKIVGESLLRGDLSKIEKATDYSGRPIECWQVKAWKKSLEGNKDGKE